jgi:DNA-binding MarR family transcriptional regulator
VVYEPRDDVHVLALLGALDRRIDRDLRELRSAYAAGMRGSHGRILGQIADEGSRPSALAAGWISKQAIGQRIRELEERGWVSVAADPSDRRAVVVRRTEAGERVRDATVAAIAAMEERWAAAVGAERYAAFRAVLDELGSVLDVEDPGEVPPPPPDEPGREPVRRRRGSGGG